jgi:hypothetical protein
MSDNWTGRMGGQWQSGSVPVGTTQVIQMNSAPLPCTVTLKSSAAGRLIEISTDGGVEYFTLAPDQVSATQLAGAILAPVSHVRITGALADVWSIR